MKLRNILSIALLAMLCTSCMSLALSVMGINKKESGYSVYSDSIKTVVFIPMKHIGPKEFYANVKHRVDSLQKEGYIVFMESVRVTDSLTDGQKDTLKRKVRKLTGVTLSKEGYLDTINGRLLGRKFKNRHGLINQPRYSKLGVDTIGGSRIVDVPMNMIIEEYEKQYGTIILNECDFTTPFEDKYKCGRENKAQADAMILNHRNRHLADAVLAEKHNKIVILYGALHEIGFFSCLLQPGSKWEQIHYTEK
jgi:hypothetical protein